MGGKRELRRCMSLMDNPQDLSQELLSRTDTQFKNHRANTFCPITIHIDGCSSGDDDDDEDPGDESGFHESGRRRRRRENNHVTGNVLHTALSDHKAVHNPRTSSPVPPKIHIDKVSSNPPSSSVCFGASPNFLEIPENSDMFMLKATAVRLKLRTRTSSFAEWQSKWLDKSRAPPEFPFPVGEEEEEEEEDGEGEGEGERREGGRRASVKWSPERKERIDRALSWLKTELKEMQSMDQHLARQLLSLRHDIHQLRLTRSCQQHQDLLDDVQSELEEQEELSDVLDLPNAMLSNTPLKQIGVTRMNISARRFSTC